MELLNLIPIAVLAWVFFRAFQTAMATKDTNDTYFKVVKIKTGKKFHNLFGVPKNL